MIAFLKNNISLLVGMLIGIAICLVFFNKVYPLPAAASSNAQQKIAETSSPNAFLRKFLVPQTDSQWKTAIEKLDSARDFDLDELTQRLNITISNESINGVSVHRITPADTSPATNALFLYIHGGAYILGGGIQGVVEGALISSLTGIETISIDYRMPPEHPFPAAIDDIEVVYRELLKTKPNTKFGIGGTSAGGGLSAGSIHNFKTKGLPLPNALYLGTPWTDVTKTSDTLYTLEGIDQVLVTYDGFLEAAALLYANEEDLKHPFISPVYGDASQFPPTYLVSGTRDLLLSDTVRMHRNLRQAGVEADLNVYEGLSHAQYAFFYESPESKQHYSELTAFLLKNLTQ